MTDDWGAERLGLGNEGWQTCQYKYQKRVTRVVESRECRSTVHGNLTSDEEDLGLIITTENFTDDERGYK